MISKQVYLHLDTVLTELRDYIRGTYGEHYVGETAIQNIDEWEANGSLVTTCRDTASKYLKRFGKKEGFNKKDLLKALHYIIIMYVKLFPPRSVDSKPENVLEKTVEMAPNGPLPAQPSTPSKPKLFKRGV